MKIWRLRRTNVMIRTLFSRYRSGRIIHDTNELELKKRKNNYENNKNHVNAYGVTNQQLQLG